MNFIDNDKTAKLYSSKNILILTECNDPARPPVRGCNKKFIHWKLRRTVENIYFRIFTFLLIIIDICLVITGRVYIPFLFKYLGGMS